MILDKFMNTPLTPTQEKQHLDLQTQIDDLKAQVKAMQTHLGLQPQPSKGSGGITAESVKQIRVGKPQFTPKHLKPGDMRMGR
jgi:hypothetical protein